MRHLWVSPSTTTYHLGSSCLADEKALFIHVEDLWTPQTMYPDKLTHLTEIVFDDARIICLGLLTLQLCAQFNGKSRMSIKEPRYPILPQGFKGSPYSFSFQMKSHFSHIIQPRWKTSVIHVKAPFDNRLLLTFIQALLGNVSNLATLASTS